MLRLRDALAYNAKKPSGKLFRFYKVVDRIAQQYDAAIAAAFVRAIFKTQQDIDTVALEKALRSGSIQRIEKTIEQSMLGRMAQELQTPFATVTAAVGTAQAEVLTSTLKLGAQFNARHPNVILFARDQSALLVQDITADVRAAIRVAVALGASEGITVRQQAKMIRQLIGLPSNWMDAPANLAIEIRAGDIAAATARKLSAVAQSQIKNRILAGTVDDAFVEQMQDLYATGLINLRAQTIAATESIRSANFGQRESWMQAIDGGVLPKESRQFWIATPGACDECIQIPEMNADGIPLSQPFKTPYGPLPYPPAHPRCRCGMGLGLA